jgi:hypothetical protein
MTREQYEKADELISGIELLQKSIDDIEDLLGEDGSFYAEITLVPDDFSGNKRAEDFYVSKEDLKNVFLPFLRNRLAEKEKQFAEL